MKYFKSMLTFLIFVVFVSSAQAGTFQGLVERIQTKSNGYFIVFVTASNNNECNSNIVMISDPNSAGANRIYSALLAYQAQKKEVQFSIGSCSDNVGLFSKIEDKS